MQNSEFIQFFAEGGYQLDPDVIAYLMIHDPTEIRNLFDKYAPEIIVVSLPMIRILQRFENLSKTITITINSWS